MARILLVDNSESYRCSLIGLLELEDYQVVTATSVEEGMEQLKFFALLDLALVDLRLADDNDPLDVSGIEVAERAREVGVPCIMISAQSPIEVTRRVLRSGDEGPLALDFIPKDQPLAIVDAIGLALCTAKR